MTLEELITLDEAGRISGRSAITLRGAAQHGTLDARKFGTTWVTTTDAVSRYMAYVAATGWARAPQHRRAGALRQRRRPKPPPAA